MRCVFNSQRQQLRVNKLQDSNLANGHIVVLGTDHLHLNALHQSLKLVPNVAGSSHGAELDEILIAPLRGMAALHPLRENIHRYRYNNTGVQCANIIAMFLYTTN